MNNLFRGAALFIGGALVGAAAAMLLTPKSGEEVRQQIADYADEAKQHMQEYCDRLKQNLAEANAAGEQPKEETVKEEA